MAAYLDDTAWESKAPPGSDAGGAGFHFADTPLKRGAEVIPHDVNCDQGTFPDNNALIAGAED